jgi:hypothetical protein
MSDERSETYVSTDIETDGPIPGANSMLSFASVAYDGDGRELGIFVSNPETLAEATPDAKTMEWWQTQPDAWAACRQDLRPPGVAMRDYDLRLRSLPGRPVFVAYPLLFDMMFVYWYQLRFVGESPFGHSGIDIKTMAYAALGLGSYRSATKRNMPRDGSARRPIPMSRWMMRAGRVSCSSTSAEPCSCGRERAR